MGVVKGMIHISQTMDDYVSISKTGSLTGKNHKKALKVGDNCMARIVAISYKGEDSKIGLTMRQPGLGKLEWIKAEKEKAEKVRPKQSEESESEKPAKGNKKENKDVKKK
jgi:DNA-directed RNA polymerase subunit E'